MTKIRRLLKHRRERQERAEEMKAHRATLTVAQQLARLDARLGVGIGAKRERARLAK